MMDEPEQKIIEFKVRRAVGVNALRKIGNIVAQEQQAETDKNKVVRWFVRYGWVVLTGCALCFAFIAGWI